MKSDLKGSIRMNMKFFRSLLAVLLLCLMLVPCALAEELMIGEGQLELYSEGAFPEPPVLRQATFATRSKTVQQVIYEGIMAQEVEIDISNCGIQADDLESLKTILGNTVQNIVNNEPDLFFIDKNYSFGYYKSGDQYVAAYITPTYLYTGAEFEAEMSAYNSAVNAIVADARKADTTVGQLLRANDYICLNFEYDERVNSSSEAVREKAVRKPNEFFKQGTGVCQAYTLAFKAVCDRLGITSTTAVSSVLNHIWNMVNVGGEWYHVDVTWNDPTPDEPLFVRYNNFLRSDDGISSTGHRGWESNYDADSTKYDDKPWVDVSVPLSVVNDKVYYNSVENFVATLHCYDLQDGSIRDLYSYNISSAYSSGVPCYSNGVRIYLSTGYHVYSVDMNGEDYRLEYISDPDLTIKNIVVKANEVSMFIGDGSQGRVVTFKVDYPLTMTIVPAVMAMQPGETLQLVVTVEPEPEEMPALTYVTSQPLVVSFDADGVMTAGVPGTATVTAKISDTVFAEASVNVHTANAAVLPANTTTIGSEAFKSMPTVEFILPEGVETIGSGAFAGCDDLMYINLPASLTEIAGDAFDGDSAVTLIVDEGSAAHSFAKGSGLKTIVVPAAASADESAAENTVIAE